MRSAEAKLVSSYLRLIDYTNFYGALFLPLTYRELDSKSISDYPLQLRTRAKSKVNFYIFQRFSDYLQWMAENLNRTV